MDFESGHTSVPSFDVNFETLYLQTKESLESVQMELKLIKQTQNIQNVDVDYRHAMEHAARLQLANESLQTELNALSARMVTLSSQNSDISGKLEESHSAIKSLSFSNSQLETEKNLAVNQADWLNKELTRVHSEYNSARIAFQNELNEKSNDMRLESLQKQLQSEREALLAQRESDSRELLTANKLVELHKKSAEMERERLEKTEKSIDQLQEAVTLTQSSYELKLAEVLSQKTELEVSLREKAESYNNLKLKYNELEKRLQNISEEVPSVPLSVSPPPELSLLEIYSSYQSTLIALRSERAAKGKSDRACEEALKENEMLMEMLKHERSEMSKLSKSHEILTNRVASLGSSLELSDSIVVSLRADLNSCQRNEKRARQEVTDLSNQVRALLYKEIEEKENPEENEANQVVTKRLVAFGNIDELQKKNVELLAVVRTLTDDFNEERDKYKIEVNDQMNKRETFFKAQLEEFREINKRQEERAQAALLQLSMLQSVQSASISVAPTFVGNSSVNESSGELIRYIADKAESDRIYATQLDSLRSEASNAKLSLVRTSAELQFTQERLSQLNEEYKLVKNQSELAHKKNVELNASMSVLENTVLKQSKELETCRNQVTSLTFDLEASKRREQFAKESELRLLADLSRLTANGDRQERLIATLSTLQSSVERREEESSRRIVEECQRKDMIIASLNIELESSRLAAKDALTLHSSEVADMRLKQNETEKECIAAREAALSLNTKISTLELVEIQYKNTISELRAEVAKLKVELQAFDTPMEVRISQYKFQIKELDEDKKLLNIKLDDCGLILFTSFSFTIEKQLHDMKKLAEGSESAYKQLKETSEIYMSRVVLQQKNESDLRLKLESRIESLNSEALENEKEHTALCNSFELKIKELTFKLDSTAADVVILKVERDNLIDRCSGLSNDVALHLKAASDSQALYHRELESHASTAKNLRELNESVDAIKQDLKSTSLALSSLQGKYKSKEEECEAVRLRENDAVQNLNKQLQNARERNELLLAQVTSSARMSNEQVESNANEIIKFLRCEKDIAVTQCEALNLSLLKLKQERDILLSDIESLKSTPPAIESSVFIPTETKTIQLLTDSNTLLREEAVRLKSSLVAIRSELELARAALVPTSQSLSDLEAQVAQLRKDKADLEEECKRWKLRTEQVLTKYHQIDPEIHANLGKTLELTLKERDDLKNELESKSGLSDTLSKLSSDLKIEKELSTKLNLDVVRLKAQVEVFKKKSDDSSKNKAQENIADGKIKLVEESRDVLLASLTDFKLIAAKKLAAMVVLLSEGRSIISKKSQEIISLTTVISALENKIRKIETDVANLSKEKENYLLLHKKEKEKSDSLITAYETKWKAAQLELENIHLKKSSETTVISSNIVTELATSDVSKVEMPVITAPKSGTAKTKSSAYLPVAAIAKPVNSDPAQIIEATPTKQVIEPASNEVIKPIVVSKVVRKEIETVIAPIVKSAVSPETVNKVPAKKLNRKSVDFNVEKNSDVKEKVSTANQNLLLNENDSTLLSRPVVKRSSDQIAEESVVLEAPVNVNRPNKKPKTLTEIPVVDETVIDSLPTISASKLEETSHDEIMDDFKVESSAAPQEKVALQDVAETSTLEEAVVESVLISDEVAKDSTSSNNLSSKIMSDQQVQLIDFVSQVETEKAVIEISPQEIIGLSSMETNENEKESKTILDSSEMGAAELNTVDDAKCVQADNQVEFVEADNLPESEENPMEVEIESEEPKNEIEVQIAHDGTVEADETVDSAALPSSEDFIQNADLVDGSIDENGISVEEDNQENETENMQACEVDETSPVDQEIDQTEETGPNQEIELDDQIQEIDHIEQNQDDEALDKVEGVDDDSESVSHDNLVDQTVEIDVEDHINENDTHELNPEEAESEVEAENLGDAVVPDESHNEGDQTVDDKNA